MGTSANERIALEIDSTADLAAVRETRQEVAETTKETANLTATVDQSREAWAKSGGDMAKFAENLSKLAAGEKLTEKSVAEKTETVKKVPPAYKQVTDSTRAMTLAQLSAIEMDRRMSNQLDVSSPKLRAASNAVASLAQSAATGGGSISSLSVAAGGLATNLLAVSRNAGLAASASGIGAIVTLAGVLLSVLRDTNDEMSKMDGAFANLGQYSVEGLRITEAAMQRRLQEKTAEIEQYGNRLIDIPGTKYGEKHGQDLLAEQQRIAASLVEVTRARMAAEAALGRKNSEDRKNREERDAKTAISLQAEFVRSYEDLYNKRTLSESAAARLRVERDFSEQRAAIDKLAVDEDMKTKLIVEAAALRRERLKEIEDKAAADRLAAWQKEVAAREAQASRIQKIEQQMYQATLAGVHSVVIGQESLRAAMTRAMLTPLVSYLEGLAVEHGIDALADLAFLNFAGAARHAAVATAAMAGARKVAQIGGLSWGGGGGGSAAVGSGGGSAFTPQAGAGDRNPTVIHLVTMNPYSGEAINAVQYELTRGGVLKRPVNLPPTTGLARAS